MCLSVCFQLHAWKPKYSMSYVSECVQCLSVKVLVCLHVCAWVCVCAWACVPLCVSEPTPWISGVGHSRDEQSRIKSILILARQEPVLLLGDTSTEREEKRELTLLLLLLLLSSALSLTVLRPPALPASSSSSSSSPPHCISVSLPRFLSLAFLSHAALPPPLSSSCSLFSRSSLPRYLQHREKLLAQGDGRRPFVNFKAVWRFRRVPGGSLRKPFQWKELSISEERELDQPHTRVICTFHRYGNVFLKADNGTHYMNIKNLFFFIHLIPEM